MYACLTGRGSLDRSRKIPLPIRETLAHRWRRRPATCLLLSQEPYVPWELGGARPAARLGAPPFLGTQTVSDDGRWKMNHRHCRARRPSSRCAKWRWSRVCTTSRHGGASSRPRARPTICAPPSVLSASTRPWTLSSPACRGSRRRTSCTSQFMASMTRMGSSAGSPSSTARCSTPCRSRPTCSVGPRSSSSTPARSAAASRSSATTPAWPPRSSGSGRRR